jgi:hypothetical protein
MGSQAVARKMFGGLRKYARRRGVLRAAVVKAVRVVAVWSAR